jgi:hypothetical protein
MPISELGQASFAVALVGFPLARWVASQAPAENAGVLDPESVTIQASLLFALAQLCDLPELALEHYPFRYNVPHL